MSPVFYRLAHTGINNILKIDPYVALFRAFYTAVDKFNPVFSVFNRWEINVLFFKATVFPVNNTVAEA
jgi:hypothetical protein